MALSVKIQGLPRDDGSPLWSIDNLSWWPARELAADPRFRGVTTASGYFDRVAILSPTEARELAERFRVDGLSMNPVKSVRLDNKLSLEPPECCWVAVIIYEWESGY
jgi:hypothetical protein